MAMFGVWHYRYSNSSVMDSRGEHDCAEDSTTVMKWSRDHVLTWGYRRNRMLTVDLDRPHVISSGGVVMNIDARVCFPRWSANTPGRPR
jgi:hypothetical protein